MVLSDEETTDDKSIRRVPIVWSGDARSIENVNNCRPNRSPVVRLQWRHPLRLLHTLDNDGFWFWRRIIATVLDGVFLLEQTHRLHSFGMLVSRNLELVLRAITALVAGIYMNTS